MLLRRDDGQARTAARSRTTCSEYQDPVWYVVARHGGGSHLERYGRQLVAAEINSSFYRPHRPAIYARWHDDAATACDEGDRAIYNPFSTSCSRNMRSAVSLLQAENALRRLSIQASVVRPE